jgi:hypothetical protein
MALELIPGISPCITDGSIGKIPIDGPDTHV